jgi:hypothetical protein
MSDTILRILAHGIISCRIVAIRGQNAGITSWPQSQMGTKSGQHGDYLAGVISTMQCRYPGFVEITTPKP